MQKCLHDIENAILIRRRLSWLWLEFQRNETFVEDGHEEEGDEDGARLQNDHVLVASVLEQESGTDMGWFGLCGLLGFQAFRPEII